MKISILLIFFPFCFFSFYVSFLFSDMCKSKHYGVGKYIQQFLCYQSSPFSGLELRMSYKCWTTASKLSPRVHFVLVRQLLGLHFRYSRCGTYSYPAPGLLSTCVTRCDEFSSNHLWVSRSLVIVFSIFLTLIEDLFSATEDAIVCLHTFWISEVWCSLHCIYGGQLDKFCWKLLVVCMCVAEVRTHVFNMFMSSTKVLSPAQKAFIARVKCVRLRCN